jgi:hypothetical protein
MLDIVLCRDYTDFSRLRPVYPRGHRDHHHHALDDDQGHHHHHHHHYRTYDDWSYYIRTHRDRIW